MIFKMLRTAKMWVRECETHRAAPSGGGGGTLTPPVCIRALRTGITTARLYYTTNVHILCSTSYDTSATVGEGWRPNHVSQRAI